MTESSFQATGPPADHKDGIGTTAVRAQLLLSAYAPLFVILAVRFQGATLKWVCGLLGVLGIVHLIFVLAIARFSSSRPYFVIEVKDASSDAAGFLTTYLLPFVTIPSPSVDDIIGYLIFATVVYAIFVRSNLAQINPTLYLIGWQVALIKTDQGGSYYLACRRLPQASVTIRAHSFGGLLIRKGS